MTVTSFDFQRHLSWSCLCSTISVRGGCLVVHFVNISRIVACHCLHILILIDVIIPTVNSKKHIGNNSTNIQSLVVVPCGIFFILNCHIRVFVFYNYNSVLRNCMKNICLLCCFILLFGLADERYLSWENLFPLLVLRE